MEIAIPLLALGGFYVISNNQESKTTKKKEAYENIGIKSHLSSGASLPNTNPLIQNYPVMNVNELIEDTVNSYPNPNMVTDKYFDQNRYEQLERKGETVGQNPQQVYSLTGNYLDTQQFKHNNMVPFYGGKPKGYTYDTQIAESLLDNMVGSSSQTIKKIEQAPLFKPEENMNWTYGAPNNSEFYQSRVNPSMKNNNVKPFDSVYVGPGLDQGYTVNGSNGYNSGMEARDKWLPFTVDQLRATTNPKLTYELAGHEGPSESVVKNLGIEGRLEKNRPDRFSIHTQDRWFTTTGAEKGETLRPLQEMGVIRRNSIDTDYRGVAGSQGRQAPTAPENFEASRRTDLPGCDIPISTASGKGDLSDDRRIQSFANSMTNNHRSTLKQPDTHRSGFSAAVGAVIAPLMDYLKPTRKEEVAQNVRLYGQTTSQVSKSYVNNPLDTTKTTNKETTLYAPTFYMDNQSKGEYVNNYTPMDLTQRDTTSGVFMGSSGGHGTQYGAMSYDYAYNQHNNEIKSSTIENHANQGGTQIFNPVMNIAIHRQDANCGDGYMNPAYSRLSQMPPSVQTYGKIRVPQYYNECQMCDRIQPDILKAFKENPYTHSLTTSV